MRASFLSFSNRFYQLLLRAYPPAFRQKYSQEMAQVFRSLCADVDERSGTGDLLRFWLLIGWDWIWSAQAQWWLYLVKRRVEPMEISLTDYRDRIAPLSRLEIGLAALPFLLSGLSSMLGNLQFFQKAYDTLPPALFLLIYPALAFNWLILLGLLAGFLLSFPRWAYSYLGWAILSAGYWSMVSFYGYRPLLLTWLPLLLVVLAALLVKHSTQPLLKCFDGIWNDWTLLSFSVYTFSASLTVMFDENHHPYLLLFIAAATLAYSLGAWAYFQSRSPIHRILALLGGILLGSIISLISYATWDYQAYYGLPATPKTVINILQIGYFIILGAFMLGNAWLARWWLKRRSRPQNPI